MKTAILSALLFLSILPATADSIPNKVVYVTDKGECYVMKNGKKVYLTKAEADQYIRELEVQKAKAERAKKKGKSKK